MVFKNRTGAFETLHTNTLTLCPSQAWHDKASSNKSLLHV